MHRAERNWACLYWVSEGSAIRHLVQASHALPRFLEDVIHVVPFKMLFITSTGSSDPRITICDTLSLPLPCPTPPLCCHVTFMFIPVVPAHGDILCADLLWLLHSEGFSLSFNYMLFCIVSNYFIYIYICLPLYKLFRL